MYYVGIDIGSTASKTVVTGDREMKFVLPTGWSSKETASEIASRLLDEGIDVMSEGVRVAATGYGRVAVDYADFAYHGGRGSFCPSCLLYAPGTRHCYWFRFVQQS